MSVDAISFNPQTTTPAPQTDRAEVKEENMWQRYFGGNTGQTAHVAYNPACPSVWNQCEDLLNILFSVKYPCRFYRGTICY